MEPQFRNSSVRRVYLFSLKINKNPRREGQRDDSFGFIQFQHNHEPEQTNFTKTNNSASTVTKTTKTTTTSTTKESISRRK